MSIVTFSKNLLTKFCEQGVSDRANFLKNIAVLGWVLSSLAQTCAIIFNEKIPSKEKKFLIPQEIFDGLINATLFWFITSKATDFGKKLVLNKKILPKSISDIMGKFVPKADNMAKLKENFINHVLKYGTDNDVQVAKNAIEGMGVMTGIIGAIVANNIITPVLRNKLAGICQKKEIQKSIDNAPLNPYYGKFDYSKYNFHKNDYKQSGTFKGLCTNTTMKI